MSEALAVVAVLATFGAGFYAGAWYMARLAMRSIDSVLDEYDR